MEWIQENGKSKYKGKVTVKWSETNCLTMIYGIQNSGSNAGP